MKQALVNLDNAITASGLIRHRDFSFVLNVHDEFQLEVDEAHAETIAALAVAAIRDAGASFSFRCPLDGEAKIGSNWRDTH